MRLLFHVSTLGLREKIVMAIVWALPKNIIYWATIRAGAHATTGRWGNESPTDLKIMDVLKRWERPNAQ